MRATLALLVAVGLLTPAEANHIQGHSGGVPAVQPAPLPWAPPAQPTWRGPTPVIPPPIVLPPQPVYVPVPAPMVDESPSKPARRRAPNICATGCE